MSAARTPSRPGTSARNTSAASSLTGACCCFCQYSMIMAILAGPQPFFCCAMNGTSSQMLRGAAARATLQIASRTPAIIAHRTAEPSMHRYDDEDKRGDGDENDQQVTIAYSASGQGVLRFDWVHVRLPNRFLRFGRGKKIAQRVDVLPTSVRGVLRGLI